MADYRTLLDPSIFLGAQDFPEEKTLTISRVLREALPTRGDEEKKAAPTIYFKNKDGKEIPRKYKVPKTIMYGLSLTFGNDVDGWIGKEVKLFAAKCMAFGEVEDCIRIRFSAEIDGKIHVWLKKRKANASSYIFKGDK
jgi:hypothetical protein